MYLIKVEYLESSSATSSSYGGVVGLSVLHSVGNRFNQLKNYILLFYCIPYLPDLGMFSKEDNSDQTSIRAVGIDGFSSLNSGLLGKLSEKLQEI